MKVCSFLPGVTDIMYQMGLEKYLHGVTSHCPSDRPKIVRSRLNSYDYTSEEIDQIVSEASMSGTELYYIDVDLLQDIAPDIVFTQHICDVCQVSTSAVEQAIKSLKKQPQVIPLNPRRLADVYDNAYTIASALKEEKTGLDHLAHLENRVSTITDKLRKHQVAPRRVMLMEWMNPIYNCAHWMPDQIALAGGIDMLANPAGNSTVIPWEKVRQYDPEVIVIAACGFEIDRSIEDIDQLTSRPGWHELTAVKNNSVYVADSRYFTMPSTTLVDGIELLASLFHPHIFDIPKESRDKVMQLSEKIINV